MKFLNTVNWMSELIHPADICWELGSVSDIRDIIVERLEKAMATHSSILAWRIPGTVEPGGLPFKGSHRVGYDWSDLAATAAAAVERYTKIPAFMELIFWWRETEQ